MQTFFLRGVYAYGNEWFINITMTTMLLYFIIKLAEGSLKYSSWNLFVSYYFGRSSIDTHNLDVWLSTEGVSRRVYPNIMEQVYSLYWNMNPTTNVLYFVQFYYQCTILYSVPSWCSPAHYNFIRKNNTLFHHAHCAWIHRQITIFRVTSLLSSFVVPSK